MQTERLDIKGCLALGGSGLSCTKGDSLGQIVKQYIAVVGVVGPTACCGCLFGLAAVMCLLGADTPETGRFPDEVKRVARVAPALITLAMPRIVSVCVCVCVCAYVFMCVCE